MSISSKNSMTEIVAKDTLSLLISTALAKCIQAKLELVCVSHKSVFRQYFRTSLTFFFFIEKGMKF